MFEIPDSKPVVAPRRGQMDAQDRLWFAQYRGDRITMLDTKTHGTLKNYQWVNRPLALIGRVTRLDGTSVDVSIGQKPGDAVLMITDLAPHVDNDFRDRKNRDVIQTEELDPILALTLALAAFGAIAGVIAGGHVAKTEGAIADSIDSTPAAAGFGIRGITVTGNARTSTEAVAVAEAPCVSVTVTTSA